MSVFPTLVSEPLVNITPASSESIHSSGNPRSITASASSAVYPSSNRAIFIPFYLSKPITVQKMFAYNGATVSGNIDLGIYDVLGTRIVSTGSTAQAGTNTIQSVAVSSTQIGPGVFYLAIAMDNTTGTLFKQIMGQVRTLKPVGCAEMSTAFALPATATFATVSSDYIPLIGLSTRSVV